MDTAKIRVKRITSGAETVTGFSYLDGDHYSHFAADETKDEFDMTPSEAQAAVETGGFAVSESSKSTPEDKADTQPLTIPE